jgi:uncharacterized membrane protein
VSPLNYAIPILLLMLTIAAFFGIARGRYADFGVFQAVLRVIAALPLLVSGILFHFFHATTTASIIPPDFPAPLFLVFITGIFEVAGAIGLFIPRFRRTAAFCIAIMMVAIVPANIYAAGRTIAGVPMPGIAPRTALQFVYIVLVLLAGYGIPGDSKNVRSTIA